MKITNHWSSAFIFFLLAASIKTTSAIGNSNFTMLNVDGTNANGGANDVTAIWNGVTTTDVANTNFSNMTISSTTPFFGVLWDVHHIRVFGPGTYSFDTTCTVAQLEAGITDCNNPLQTTPSQQTERYITMVVAPGQVGAHMLFNWNDNDNNDVVNVYDINAAFITDPLGGLYTGGGYGPYPWSGEPSWVGGKWRLASTDNDGDGIAGVPMVDGSFIGFNPNFNLDITEGDGNFTVLHADGTNANGGANDVTASWNGVTTTDIADTNFGNMTLASDTPFFGELWSAHHIRVFGPGSYTFDTTCTVAQLEAGITNCNNPLQTSLEQTERYLTMTVASYQIGIHILFDWNGYKNIDIANVFDTINPSVFYNTAPGWLYTGGSYSPYPWSGAPHSGTFWNLSSTDNDSDGIAGIPMIDGPLIGFNPNFNLFEALVTVFDGNWILGAPRNIDEDIDGISGQIDNCPIHYNPTQVDTDNDAFGDACDIDDDNDGTADTTDAYPLDPTKDTAEPSSGGISLFTLLIFGLIGIVRYKKTKPVPTPPSSSLPIYPESRPLLQTPGSSRARTYHFQVFQLL